MLNTLLLAAAVVLLACVAFHKASDKLGVPVLLAFIALGMLFGTDGILKIPFDNYAFAEQICTVALIFIMFYGGFGTSWPKARPVAAQAVLLSTLGVVATAVLTGLFCHFVLGLPLLQGLLLGSVLGSTDAASVFSILRARKLALKENTASLLELESGSNDPCAFLLTTVVLAAMQGGVRPRQVAALLAGQVVFGLAFGVGLGLAALALLRKVRLGSGFDAIFVVAAALLAYALPASVGGNGYLSVYLAGILLGNAQAVNRKTLVPFFDGLTNLAQVALFFLLGLLCTPSQMPRVLGLAAAAMAFITLVARPAAVFGLLAPFGAKSSHGQKLLVSWAGLRGASGIVFAVMAVVSPATTDLDVFHIAFLVVLFSISLQGTLLPAVAARLDMLAEHDDALSIFTDYTDEVPVQFIQCAIVPGHPWCDKALRELTLPPGAVVASLRRGSATLAPGGDTVLQAGDDAILCAHAPGAAQGIALTERTVTESDLADGARVCDLPRHPGAVIVLVRRGEAVIIPDGATILLPGDVLVLHRSDGENM